MEMIARVRLVLDVPFEFDVDEPDENGHSQSRIEAAKHAETNLVNKIVEQLSDVTVVDDLTLIEEVREAVSSVSSKPVEATQ